MGLWKKALPIIFSIVIFTSIGFSTESFAKPQDSCTPWPDCKNGDSGSGGGNTSFDFSLGLSSNSISIEQGHQASITVTVSQASGSGNVNLSTTNIPGISISFNPSSNKISPNDPSFSSLMVIDVLPDSTPGLVQVNIDASGKGTTKTDILNLTVLDLTPPQTTIDSSPTNPSDDTNPSFTFSANEPSTFECEIDGGNFFSCFSGDFFGPLDDGFHTFQVKAIDFGGNQDPTPASYIWLVDTSSTINDPVIVAAGDIACNTNTATTDTCHHQATSDLIMSINPTAVLTLGDNQYENGELANYNQFYDPTWGRAFSKTYPSPGNHEYNTAGAAGYFAYFGDRSGNSTGYYSFDIGSWHIVSLNSNCSQVGGCSTNSPQSIWLDNDLASHNNACTLVYWHHPRFSAGTHGNNTSMDYFWQLLDAHNVDVALAGHDHNYQRFYPMDLTGSADPQGIREFVVGTGGKTHYSLTPDALSTLEAYNTSTYGVLKMTLHDTSYDWEFVGESGNVIDSGTWDCNAN
jgi:hypothetical protein